jgi:serine/threonine protein kinase
MTFRPASPISTTFDLSPPEEDLLRFTWLANSVRYYAFDPEPLGDGAFGTAYAGRPTTKEGEPLGDTSTKLVVKVPKLIRNDRTESEIRARQNYIREKILKEFYHIRTRLIGCRHANPIIDLAFVRDDTFDLAVTIQPFLSEAINLDEWLHRRGLRQFAPTARQDYHSPRWSGINNTQQWAHAALQIATAIKDIHLRRVTHGDVHPGNIFISTDSEARAILIDFGEAFVATPGNNWRVRKKNTYLAPERSGARLYFNEKVDVYSFGMLLLYLATGSDREISLEHRPGRHRAHIHERILAVNPSIVRDEPRVLDVIGKSTARDPTDRPTMTDICDDLLAISAGLSHAGDTTSVSIATALNRLSTSVDLFVNRHSPLLMGLIEKNILLLENVVEGLKTEMVDLAGTREHLLRMMISLFDQLQENDSWTTATTLALWQRRALGLDGSYAAATIRAVKRGASVRRTFVVSIEELGYEFSTNLMTMLLSSEHASLIRLGKHFQRAIAEYGDEARSGEVSSQALDFIRWHRERFIKVLALMQSQISIWELDAFINRDSVVNVKSSQHLYLGICPVGTLRDVGAIREDNPVSLVYIARETEPSRQWLLVRTEVCGRIEEREGVESSYISGVRVFRSVMGIPEDRITLLQRLMNDKSVNVAPTIATVLSIARDAEARL